MTSGLSKQLDSVTAEWLNCLRLIVATALLTKDADKLTLRQPLIITTSCHKGPLDWYISSAKLIHYQSLLLNHPWMSSAPSTSLNLTFCCLIRTWKTHKYMHDSGNLATCAWTLARPDWSTLAQGRSHHVHQHKNTYMKDGFKYAGAAVMDLDLTLWVFSPEWDLDPKGRTHLTYSNWAMAKRLLSTLTFIMHSPVHMFMEQYTMKEHC